MLKSKSFEAEEEKVIIVGSIDSCSKSRKKNNLQSSCTMSRENKGGSFSSESPPTMYPNAIAKFDLID